jgi:hypothetical protein
MSLCIRRSQSHEHPENDDTNYRHQNEVTVSFHYQCLARYIEALMAMLAIPMIVPADDLRGVTTTGGPTPLGRSDPVLRFVRSRQRFVRCCHGQKRPQPFTAGAS